MQVRGSDILDHFSERLAALEASESLPAFEPVQRLPSPPLDLHELTSSYQGTPALFPFSWAPSFSKFNSCALSDLLGGILEVEVFRLHYKQCDDHCPSQCAISLVNSSESSTVDGYMSKVPDAQQMERDSVQPAFAKGLWLHPIPTSTTEVVDFKAFTLDSSSLLLDQKSQLLYLTWRSLPARVCTGQVPEEFCYLIDNLIHPVTTPNFIHPETIKQRNLWMGCLITSRIHFDSLDNLHVCLSGTKILHLYPPSELPNLYPEPWKPGSMNNFSQIGSAFLANHKDHALYFQCRRLRAEINAGEAIFIPAGWWHEVFTLQPSLSINVWFGPSKNALFRPTLLHLKSENYLKFMMSRKM